MTTLLPGVIASGVAAEEGHGSSAVNFDASGDYYVASAAASDVTTSAFTAACWVNLNATPTGGDHGIVSISKTGPDTFWQIQTNGVVQARLADNGSSIGIPTGSFALPVGAWAYVAATFNSTGTTGWLYGGLTSDVTLITATGSGHVGPSTASKIHIGRDVFAQWCNCKVAGVKMWNATLSAAEIALERWAYDPVRTANLYAWYPFDNGPDTTDHSGNGHTLVANGSISTATGPPYTS